MFSFILQLDATSSNTEYKTSSSCCCSSSLLEAAVLKIGFQFSFNVSESDTLIERARTSTPVIIQNINITGAIEAIKGERERERDKGRGDVVFLPVELFVFPFIHLPAALPPRFT